MKMISANKLNRLWKNGVVAKMVAKIKVLKTMEEVRANTDAENVAGATVVKELSNKIDQIRTYVGTDGKLHSVDGTGADTVLYFNNLDMPLRIIGGSTAQRYVTIPTFRHNLKINCASLSVPSSNGHVYLWGSDAVDFSTASVQQLGALSRGEFEVNAKDYNYVIVRHASSDNASFHITVNWI